MVKLEVSSYDKVIKPLKSVPINTLFAKAVVYCQIPGMVFVDNVKEPKAFYVTHPYGMSLLFGDTENENFNRCLFEHLTNVTRTRENYEWLQVFPDTWNTKLETILGSCLVKKDDVLKFDDGKKVVENTRINFIFNIDKYKKSTSNLNKNSYQIVNTTKEMFRNMTGSVIPKYFWTNEDQFKDNGIGYSIICNEEIAATAFSAFRFENNLEIGIETLEKYRGKGLAMQVCSAIIDYCMENSLEPIWACRLENNSSYNLAQKLGFMPSLSIPYYRLVL